MPTTLFYFPTANDFRRFSKEIIEKPLKIVVFLPHPLWIWIARIHHVFIDLAALKKASPIVHNLALIFSKISDSEGKKNYLNDNYSFLQNRWFCWKSEPSLSTMGAAFFRAAEHDEFSKFMKPSSKWLFFMQNLDNFNEKMHVFLQRNDEFLTRRCTFSFQETTKISWKNKRFPWMKGPKL